MAKLGAPSLFGRSPHSIVASRHRRRSADTSPLKLTFRHILPRRPVDPQRQQGAESSEPYRGRDFGSLRASREQHYTSLGMPWPAASPVAAFAQALSVRRGWNRGGKLESGQADFYGGSSATTLADLANSHDGGKNTPSTLAPTVIVWYRRVMRLRRLWGQETRQQGWEVPRPCCYLLGAGPAAWH